MIITASEDTILIKGYGRYNQTVRFDYSEKHGGWLLARKGRPLTGRGMTLNQVIAWAKIGDQH